VNERVGCGERREKEDELNSLVARSIKD